MVTKWKTVSTSTLTPTDNTKRKEALVKSLNVEAELLEVHWLSGIDAARNKTKITAPHWKLGDKVEEEDKADTMHFKTGSQKPGVYLIAGKGVHDLKVKIKVIKSGLMGEATLRGKLGSLTLSGDFNASVGEHMVSMKIEKPPKECQHIEGDATWMLDAGSAGSKDLKDKTRLEVFFVLDKPMSFYTQGVWVEALRLAFSKASVIGVTEPSKVAAGVTKYCHTGHGMKYDTRRGAPAFFGGSPKTGVGDMSLWNYILKTPSNIVNCYDQAAVVQAFSGALGVKVDWHYLAPYGYINTTNLIGVGSCNNPFFNSNGSTPVVASDSPNRTAFGNHAFIGFNGKIFDSCAGPHAGSETPRKYLENAIDDVRTIKEIGLSSMTPPATLGSYLEAGYLKKSSGITGVD
jgi:hypothetical protein